MKLYEYLAAGAAIVAPDQATVREIVEEGVTALLFEPGNGKELGAALTRLIEYAALREQMRSSAREEATKHSWTQRAGILEREIDSILTNSKSS